jgi:predicted transcriptional regulator
MKRSKPDGSKSKNLGKYETGLWTDWVFHVKWSWESDGLLEVWKNGKKVIHYEGPIGYNDRRGVYFKTGIYKWVWKMTPERDHSTTTKRVTYVDEVRIGNENATYQDVVRAGVPTVTK